MGMRFLTTAKTPCPYYMCIQCCRVHFLPKNRTSGTSGSLDHLDIDIPVPRMGAKSVLEYQVRMYGASYRCVYQVRYVLSQYAAGVYISMF